MGDDQPRAAAATELGALAEARRVVELLELAQVPLAGALELAGALLEQHQGQCWPAPWASCWSCARSSR